MNHTMRQQINLLQDELRERKPVLPAIQLVLASAAAIAVMALVAFWMDHRLQAPRAELAWLDADIQARSAAVAQLATRLEAHKPDPALALEARRLEERLDHLRRITAITIAPGAGQRLSAYLEGLGRQRPEGLWLTRIVVANGGADVALGGSALEPGLLPAYLESLGTEQAFTGLTFGNLVIERSATEPRRLDFRIAAGCLTTANSAAHGVADGAADGRARTLATAAARSAGTAASPPPCAGLEGLQP